MSFLSYQKPRFLLLVGLALVLAGLIWLAWPMEKENHLPSLTGEEEKDMMAKLPDSVQVETATATPSYFASPTQEQVVARYLRSQEKFSWNTVPGSHRFCSLENLEPENELFPFHVWAYCSEYVLEDGVLQELSGSSGPVEVDYPNELSFYDQSRFSFRAPGDGAAYAFDVEEIFPANIQEKILSFDPSGLIARARLEAAEEIAAWKNIKDSIVGCQVEEIFQAHDLSVSATLKDGRRLRAVEPEIDAIIDAAIAAEPECGRIVMATE